MKEDMNAQETIESTESSKNTPLVRELTPEEISVISGGHPAKMSQ